MTNQKSFGVWMDTQEAVIIGKAMPEAETVSILAAVKGEKSSPNSSEKTMHNQAKALQAKFFKAVTAHLQNATYIHVTGTGQIQEQFIHYLKDTPQFKNTRTDESTANKMSDQQLVTFMSSKLN
jgi:hypothetical protein